jgi:hypothetical protein
VSRRWRLAWYGSAAALVVAGVLCAVLIGGVTGEALTIVLLSLGLGEAVLLVFYEVGSSEDRDLARTEERSRQRDQRALDQRRRRWQTRLPRRPR